MSKGQKIGNFTILEVFDIRRSNNFYYFKCKCLCDCGVEFIASKRQLMRNRKSCGCLSVDARFKKSAPGIAPMRAKLCQYRNSAKARGLEFNLSENDFHRLILGNCYYCNRPPADVYKTHLDSCVFNGIDRVDSTLGYFIDNCVSCCRFCNMAKSDLSVDKFLDWINWIKNYEKT